MTDPLNAARLKLNDAVVRMREADRAHTDANRERTAATNDLNEAQKGFDAIVERIRSESATLGSDWGRGRFK